MNAWNTDCWCLLWICLIFFFIIFNLFSFHSIHTVFYAYACINILLMQFSFRFFYLNFWNAKASQWPCIRCQSCLLLVDTGWCCIQTFPQGCLQLRLLLFGKSFYFCWLLLLLVVFFICCTICCILYIKCTGIVWLIESVIFVYLTFFFLFFL